METNNATMGSVPVDEATSMVSTVVSTMTMPHITDTLNPLCALNTTSTPPVITLVYFHDNCHDGLAAALASRLALGDSAQYIPVRHGSPPDLDTITGAIVYMLDICFGIEYMSEAIRRAKSLLVIDHHKTAQSDMEKIGIGCSIFDMQESGATLAWYHFHPGKPLPMLFRYVRARDLWTKDMPDTDAFHLAFDLAARDENNKLSLARCAKYVTGDDLNDPSSHLCFDRCQRHDTMAVSALVAEGRAMMRYHESLVAQIAQRAWIACAVIDDKPYLCATVNTPPQLASDVGNKMLELHHCDLAVCYNLDSAHMATYFSLRAGGKCDVSVLARQFGGGGHANAAGCKIDSICNQLPLDYFDARPLIALRTDTMCTLRMEKVPTVLTPQYISLLLATFPELKLQLCLEP